MIGPSFEGRPLRVGHVFVLLLSLGVLIATLFGFIAHHSGPQHIPADPGTPASVTTIGVPR